MDPMTNGAARCSIAQVALVEAECLAAITICPAYQSMLIYIIFDKQTLTDQSAKRMDEYSFGFPGKTPNGIS